MQPLHVAICEDITDKKKATEMLAISESRYRSLFENMNAGFVLFEVVLNVQGDPVDLLIVAANSGFEETTGLNLKDATGEHLTEVLPGIEKDEADWIGTYSKVALTGKSIQFEQGSELLGYYYSISAFRAAQNQCAVSFLNITERKQTEKHNWESAKRAEMQRNLIAKLSFEDVIVNKPIDEALKLLITHFAEILKVERTSIWLLSEDDKLLKRMMLYDSATGIDSQVEVLNTAEFPSYFKALYKDSQIDAYDAQNDPRTKDLSEIYFIPLKISSMLDSAIQRDGRIIGVLSAEHRGPVRKWLADEESLSSSLTNLVSQLFSNAERKKAEDEIKNLNKELEQKVKERTTQLESINNQLQAFTYSVSHDLKAPLRGINGYSKLLQEMYSSSLDEEAQTFIKNIKSGTGQMNQLIDDLLTYSRLERSRIKKTKVDVRKVINNTLSFYSKEIEERNIKVTIEGNCKEIIIDNDSFNIVIRNLIENAVKFTSDSKKPIVQIQISDTDSKFLLSVKDNGVGFDMKFHDKIFEIFQRLHRVEDYPGTGIGLALVYKAIEKMGGKIWAKGELSEGAQFFIELPKNKIYE